MVARVPGVVAKVFAMEFARVLGVVARVPEWVAKVLLCGLLW